MKRLTSCGRVLLAVFGIWLWLPSHLAAAAGTGNLYVADWPNGVKEFTPGGVESYFAGVTAPFGLAFDRSGNLFVSEADASTNSIIKVTPSGVQSTFASGLDGPNGLAFDSSGNLFEADASSGTIYKFTPSGVQSTFASGLDEPNGLAFDSSGDLFVTDSNAGDIYKFTPSGVRSTFASGLGDPIGLAFNSSGILFEADHLSSRIYEFTPSGSQSTFAIAPWNPVDLAFDSSGNLFVSDLNYGSVSRIRTQRDLVRLRWQAPLDRAIRLGIRSNAHPRTQHNCPSHRRRNRAFRIRLATTGSEKIGSIRRRQ